MAPRMSYLSSHDFYMNTADFTQMELITLCAHAAGIITRSRLTRNCGGVRTGCAVFSNEQELVG